MLKGRLEDDRMLMGRGRYVSDWNLPGQAYAHFVRSDRAHAEIASIDVSAALDRPGVLAVLTGKDVSAAGLKSLPCAVPVKGRGGAELLKPHRPALAQDKVRFVGEPVAIVVAETVAAAADAAESIFIEYRELPAVVRADDALADGAPQLFDDVPGNCVFDFEAGDEKAAAEAFGRAARVVRIAVDNTRVVGNPMEPRACLAHYDAANHMNVLYACTQGAAGMRTQLAGVLGVGPEKVRIVAEEVGGGFGVRFNIYPEYCATMLAAKTLGRPVKWVGSRSEVFLSDEQARDVVSVGELALDASGRFLGMRFGFTVNLGAYLCPTGPFINTVGIINALGGVYDVKAIYSRARLAVTNTAPMAAYRGAGRPVMSYVLERLVDQAAFELGMDPAELRRRNFIDENAFPYRIASGYEYDSGDFAGCLERAMQAADWRGFAARREASAKKGRLRGRGLSTYIEATGAGFAPVDQVDVRFASDGTVTLVAPTHNHGQGHETTYAQIVSSVLGVQMEQIRLRTAHQDEFVVGNATGGSRSLLAVGSVMQLAAKEVVEKGRQVAADELEAAAQDIEFRDGQYRIQGTDRAISLAALARKHPARMSVRYENKFGSTFPNGCHIAEVEIDPETGEAEIASYLACDDAGNVINHQIVEGQVQGGVTQGAGQVFAELAVYDESGQLVTGSFMDYAMPRAVLVNNLRVIEHPVPTQSNPLGAKGVGEAGVTGSLPALMNAVLDALRQAGVEEFDMPASPHRVWKALHAARAGA
ncbi:MAG TPA: xanthine dehydrogenase family protein molybdopterin-binding subunit [Burkholderiales bacterium]|nr:xanthine dehydrogenase family protein molybdopterin-binding subunit [Burkholderiales bacterium]